MYITSRCTCGITEKASLDGGYILMAVHLDLDTGTVAVGGLDLLSVLSTTFSHTAKKRQPLILQNDIKTIVDYLLHNGHGLVLQLLDAVEVA